MKTQRVKTWERENPQRPVMAGFIALKEDQTPCTQHRNKRVRQLASRYSATFGIPYCNYEDYV